MPLPFGLALPARPPLSIAATETAWPRVGVVPGEVLSDQMGRGGVGAAGVCAVVRTRAGEHSGGPPLPFGGGGHEPREGAPGTDGEGRLMSWVPRDLPWAGGLIGETPCRVPAASLPPGSFSSPQPPTPPLLLWRLSSRPACLVPLSASLFPTCLPTGYAAMEYVNICFRSYFKFFWMDINLEGELVDHMVTLF